MNNITNSKKQILNVRLQSILNSCPEDLSLIEDVILQGADLHLHDDSSIAKLILYNHVPAVELLFKHGAIYHIKNPKILRDYLDNSYSDMLKLILEYTQVDISSSHLLSYAASKNYYKSIPHLIKYGEDVNCDDNAPLCNSIFNKHIESAKILIELGADVNNNSLGYLASSNGALEILETMVKHGLDLNQKWKYILTNSGPNLNIIQYIHNQGFDCNQDNVVCYNAKNGNLEIIQFLVNYCKTSPDYILKVPNIKQNVSDWVCEYKNITNRHENLIQHLNKKEIPSKSSSKFKL